MFPGGGIWGNRWRMRLQTQPVYGDNGAIIGYFYRNGANLEFRFVETVGVGGGAVRYNRNGMTAVTDAGGVGQVPIAYDPTNNRIGIGTAAPASGVHIISSGTAYLAAANQLHLNSGTEMVINGNSLQGARAY